MAMVRAHRDGYIGATSILAFLLLQYKVFHNRVHICTAFKVVVFIKATIILAFNVTQMQEMEMLTQAFNYTRQIIIGTRP
jgi:hypothetical protein